MILMLLGFMYFQTKQAHEQQIAEQHLQDSLAKAEASMPKPVANEQPTSTQPVKSLSDSVQQALRASVANNKYGILAPSALGTATDVVMQNKLVKLTINTKGGLFTMAELIDGEYKNYHTKENIRLWDDSLSKMKLLLNLYGKGSFKSDEFYFQPSAPSVDASNADGQLTMKLATADPAKYLEIVYSLKPDAYNVGVTINAVGLGNDLELSSKPMSLEWYAEGLNNEKGISAERARSSVFYRPMDDVLPTNG